MLKLARLSDRFAVETPGRTTLRPEAICLNAIRGGELDRVRVTPADSRETATSAVRSIAMRMSDDDDSPILGVVENKLNWCCCPAPNSRRRVHGLAATAPAFLYNR